jgi:hypothetical protein
MHFLLIIILLCIVFPVFRHFVGGLLSIILWVILIGIVLGFFGVFFRG